MNDFDPGKNPSLLRVGMVTVSDRASRGEYCDRSGPAIQSCLQEAINSPWLSIARLIPDEQTLIEQTLVDLCDNEQCSLVVTTGGTGPAPRDITPEATENVCEKMLPGLGEVMRRISQEQVPTAMLSRQTAGIRGHSLIVNLPGRPQAVRECLIAILPAVPGCLRLIGGPSIRLNPPQ